MAACAAAAIAASSATIAMGNLARSGAPLPAWAAVVLLVCAGVSTLMVLWLLVEISLEWWRNR